MAFRNGFKRVKGQKYKNVKCVSPDGVEFASKKEMNRYLVLKDAENKGIITDLKLQPKFELIPAIIEEYIEHLKKKDKVKTRTVQLAITYTADFSYYKNGEYIVEDVKASPKMLPNEYLLKEKLFRWKFGFGLKRVYKATAEI